MSHVSVSVSDTDDAVAGSSMLYLQLCSLRSLSNFYICICISGATSW